MTVRLKDRAPFGCLRIVVLGSVVALLGLASLWPLGSGWQMGLFRAKWELALLEVRYPLLSVSTGADRAILQVRIDPYRPGRDSHLVFTRDAGSALWIDGVERMRLINPPGAPLLWSLDQRLWLGGARDSPGPPMSVRRLAIYDRALAADEVARLAAGEEGGAGPEPLMRLVFGADGASAGGSMEPPRMELPAGAQELSRGLSLGGRPARSVASLGPLLERIRERQAFSVELVWRPVGLPTAGALPILALEGEQDSRNFRIDASRESLFVRVRAGYPSRKRVADFVLNVAAYVPLGLALAWGRRSRRTILLACAAGLLLSLGVEALQSFRLDRIPSLIDLFTNTLGATLGAAAWHSLTFPRFPRPPDRGPRR